MDVKDFTKYNRPWAEDDQRYIDTATWRQAADEQLSAIALVRPIMRRSGLYITHDAMMARHREALARIAVLESQVAALEGAMRCTRRATRQSKPSTTP